MADQLTNYLLGKAATTDAGLAAHESAVDPHPQYLTETDGDLLYDPAGEAVAVLAIHEGDADPHPQYAAETAATVGALITAAAAVDPADADSLAIVVGGVLKRLIWSNLKAKLKTYFDGIYTTASAVATYVLGITYGRQFAYSHEDHAHTGDLLETELWSATIPGGTLGPNGVIRITSLWGMTASVNTKSIRIKFGATLYYLGNAWAAGNTQAHIQTVIRNRNVTDSQIGASLTLLGPGNNGSAFVTSSLDTNADQVISLTGQLGNTGETITLKDVFVEVLK